jgi:hypothetical protein
VVPTRLAFDDFLSWLASFAEQDVVGQPGLCFNSPLACFLSQLAGVVIGEDGQRYGRASVESHHWRALPRWAQLFSQFGERLAYGQPLTAYHALCLLVEVETALAPAPALLVCSA